MTDAESSGCHNGITLASLAAARAALASLPGQALATVLTKLWVGPCGRSDRLLMQWQRETLCSVAARRDWLAPGPTTPDWIVLV